MDNHILPCIWRFLFVLFLSGVLIFVLLWFWTVLYPFIIAVFLSALLHPFIRLLVTRFRFPKILAVLFVITLFTGLAGSMITLFIAELIKGIQYLSVGLPGHFQCFTAHMADMGKQVSKSVLERIEILASKLSPEQQQSLEEYFPLLQEKISQTGVVLLNELFEGAVNLLSSIPSSITTIFITLLATFFISKDWDIIKNYVENKLPEPFVRRVNTFRYEIKHTLFGLIKAQCTLVVVSTSIIGVGLSLIDAPYALTITFFAAILDFIPYIGTGVIFLPWIIYQFFSGEFEMTIALAIIYMIVIITRQVLEPKLLADHFGVPPVLLLLSLFVGFHLFGAYGMLLSPVVLMIIQTLNKTGVTHDLWLFIIGNKNLHR